MHQLLVELSSVLCVNHVKLVLHVVKVSVSEPNNESTDESGSSKTSVGPDELGVLGGRRQSDTNGSSNGVGEEENGHDERLHGGGSLGVGVLETGDGGENLRQSNEGVSRGLDSHMDVVGGVVLSIGQQSSRAGSRRLVTRTGRVDDLLDNGSVGHGTRSKEETEGDSGDGSHLDTDSSQVGVDELLHDGDEDDDGNGVNVLHDIVGDTVGLHLASLRHKVVEHLSVDNPVDGVDDKDLASNEGSSDLIDKQISPGHLRVAVLLSERGLGSIKGLLLGSSHNDSEGLGDNRAHRRSLDVVLVSKNQGSDGDKEKGKRKQVSSPEINVSLQVGGGNGRQRSDVDAHVEDHENGLDGHVGVDNDSLAGLEGSDVKLGVGVLLGNQRRNVRLDTSSTQTNDNHGSDQTSQTSSSVQGRGQRGDEKNQVTGDVNQRKDKQSLVLAPPGIGNDGSENGSDVTPELEKVGQSGSCGLTQVKSTSMLAETSLSLHIVLERTGNTVVGESLTQLDNSHHPGSLGKSVRDSTQSQHLLLGRLRTKSVDCGGHLMLGIVVGVVRRNTLSLHNLLGARDDG